MRLAYFGTSSFAVPALESLAHKVKLVVTQPSRPSGRGNLLLPTPVGLLAQMLGIEVLGPEKASDPAFIEDIENRGFDALVVASYGQILTERLLGAARFGGINLHASILPKYRGAAPIARAILADETETGVTLMQMDKGMDSGDIIAIETLEIGVDETAGQLEGRLSELAAAMAAAWLPRIVAGGYPRTPQGHALATVAPKLRSDEGAIAFSQPAQEAYRRFRALTPRPGAVLTTNRGPLKLIRCRLGGGAGEPGTLLSKGPEALEVAFAEGSLAIREAQPTGKKPMGWNDLANGWRLNEGERL